MALILVIQKRGIMSNSINPDGKVPNQQKQVTNKDSVKFRHSSKYKASQDFFPSMPMSKPEFKKFMNNLLHFIAAQIKQDEKHQKEASEQLKRSEKGE